MDIKPEYLPEEARLIHEECKGEFVSNISGGTQLVFEYVVSNKITVPFSNKLITTVNYTYRDSLINPTQLNNVNSEQLFLILLDIVL